MDDLISRQAAIRWVKTECNPYGNPTLDFESGKKVIEHLKQMPSAERRGSWVGIDDEPCEVWECDQCGHIVERECPPRFCEECGARMEV